MKKCKYCNKRIWLTEKWCMKCLKNIINGNIKYEENK